MTNASAAPFSIAICTYNRPVELERCLESLVKDLRGRRIPVLVVDNCPSKPEVAAVAARFADRLALRHEAEPRAGLSVARNRAIAAADTPWIVYLDDDAVVVEGWTDAVLGCINRGAELFGGPYRSFFAETPPSWFRDAYGSAMTSWTEGPIPPERHISGGNMGWSTDLVRQLGGFPEDLGMVAGRVGLGEETWLQNEARRLRPNLTTWFDPKMEMLHLVPRYKFAVSYWIRRQWMAGYQWQRTMENAPAGPSGGSGEGSAPGITNPVLRLLWHVADSFKILGGFVIRDRSRYPTWQNYAVEVVAPKIHFWGMFRRFLEQKLGR